MDKPKRPAGAAEPTDLFGDETLKEMKKEEAGQQEHKREKIQTLSDILVAK